MKKRNYHDRFFSNLKTLIFSCTIKIKAKESKQEKMREIVFITDDRVQVRLIRYVEDHCQIQRSLIIPLESLSARLVPQLMTF